MADIQEWRLQPCSRNLGRQVTIVHSRDRLLHVMSPKVSKITHNYFKNHSIKIITEARAEKVSKNTVELDIGQKIPSDLTLLTGGMKVDMDVFQGWG